jgi:hypothetical protein
VSLLDVGDAPAPVARTIAVDVLEADASTVVGSIDMAHVVDGSIEDPIDGDGLGALTLGLESPDRPKLTKGRVLRWNGTGERPFHSIIEGNTQVSIAPGRSKAGRAVKVSGRSLLAQLDDVRVQQWPGMDQEFQQVKYYSRHFNYASPVKCNDINGDVYQHDLVLNYDADGQPKRPNQPPPVTWRDGTAYRIHTTPYEDGGGVITQRLGRSLFRTTYTPAVPDLRVHYTGDDRPLPWIGGVPMPRTPDAPTIVQYDTFGFTVRLQVGHTYPVVIANENELPPFAWIGAAGFAIDDGSSSLVFNSNDGWGGLECIDIPPPGWEAPELLEVLFVEAQAGNGLTGWEVVDKTPGLWTPMIETVFEVDRTTLLGAVRQLSDGQGEFAAVVVGGAKQLWCFAPGTMGNFHTSPAEPPVFDATNIADLTFDWVQA